MKKFQDVQANLRTSAIIMDSWNTEFVKSQRVIEDLLAENMQLRQQLAAKPPPASFSSSSSSFSSPSPLGPITTKSDSNVVYIYYQSENPLSDSFVHTLLQELNKRGLRISLKLITQPEERNPSSILIYAIHYAGSRFESVDLSLETYAKFKRTSPAGLSSLFFINIVGKNIMLAISTAGSLYTQQAPDLSTGESTVTVFVDMWDYNLKLTDDGTQVNLKRLASLLQRQIKN